MVAGIGIGLPVGFFLYLLSGSRPSSDIGFLVYGCVPLLAASLLMWSGVAMMNRRFKKGAGV